jgi:hypothetical protein
MRIVDHAIQLLVMKGGIKGEALAMDSTFIKAHSRRSLDNRTGIVTLNHGLEEQSKPET